MHKILYKILGLVFLLSAQIYLAAQTQFDCTSTYRLIIDNPPPSFELFRTLYGAANPTSLTKSQENDNHEFIKLTQSSDMTSLLFVHGMLKPLKRLNDNVFSEQTDASKKDVDAARNLFRILLHENLATHPTLKVALVAQFHDFKTIDLAFDTTRIIKPENIESEINGVIAKTQIQFEKAMLHYLNKNPRLLDKILQEHGLSGDLRAWHLFGKAIGDPDKAVLNARMGVKRFNSEIGGKLIAHSFSPEEISNRVQSLENEKTKLIESFENNSIVFTNYENTEHKVLSKKSIDILRKINAKSWPEYVEIATKNFSEIGVELSETQVRLLRDYFTAADEFQLNPRFEKRTPIEWNKATEGALSIDFGRQNVVNLYHTMGALAKSKNSPEQLIKNCHEAERLATLRLNRLKTQFELAVRKAGIEGDYVKSGDDGVVFVKETVNSETLSKVFNNLKEYSDPLSDYRVVWTPTNKNNLGVVNDKVMAQAVVKGEAYEKALRKIMESELGKHKADLKELEDTAISVRINPTLKTMQIYIFGHNSEVLKKTEIAARNNSILPSGYKIELVKTQTFIFSQSRI